MVLLDLEWFSNDSNDYLTQIAAYRTNRNWRVLDTLDLIASLPNARFYDPRHVAFGGLPYADYCTGLASDECMQRLHAWLPQDEEICVWAESNKDFLLTLWKGVFPSEPAPPIFTAAKKARRIANEFFHLSGRTPYELINRFGETSPKPAHRAINDVAAMRQIFQLLKMTPAIIKQKEPPLPPPPEKKIDYVARNRDIVSRSSYNFIFIEGKDVFHRRECRLFLTTRGVIQGAEYYKTACKGRRPCKICKPEPLPGVPLSWAEKAIICTPPERKKAHSKPPPVPVYQPVKMLDGSTAEINPKMIAGWCRFYKHPGAMTVAILQEHWC